MSLDTKVVEMRFDNKHFESNVKTSMSSLDKLKEKLNLSGATKGLENVGDAAKKVNMSGLNNVVDTVKLSFSNLEVMAVTALVNITNAAINAGKKIASAILAPIMEGGKRRALNIEQAKFQFEGLGMDVEATMADASYAVDGTAYSLDAAAKVASQLGASGMRAGEDMRNSLRAISGVAAMAGSSYEDIGNVFTKVAGQGRVMGDDLLRLSSRGINAAATIAKEMGITEAAVREMVTKGQIDFQLFANAMDSAFGEHATAANKTFTGSMSNVKSALARIGEKFYTPFHQNLIDPLNAFRVVINNVNKALDPLFKVLEKIMIKISGKIVDKLNNLSFDGLANFIQILVEGNETTDKIGRTIKGLWAILGLVKDAFKFVFDIAKEVFGLFRSDKSGKGILDLTARFGDYLVKLRDTVRESEAFKKAFEKVQQVLNNTKKVLSNIADQIKNAISRIKEAFQGFRKVDLDPLDDFSKQSEKKLKPLTRLMEMVSGVFEFIVKTIEWIIPIFTKIGSLIGQAIGKFASKFGSMIKHLEFKDILSLINTGILTSLLLGFKKFTNTLQDFTSSAGSLLGNITGILTGVQGVLESYQQNLKAKTLLTIASAIAILAASLLVLSFIDGEKLLDSMMALSMLFVELSSTMIILNRSIGETKMPKMVTMLIAFSTSILILSFAMKTLAGLDWDGVAKGVIGIGALSTMLVLVSRELGGEKISEQLNKTAKGLIVFSVAILVLVQSVKQLAKLTWEELAKGLLGLTVILAEVIIVTRLLDKEKNEIPKIGATLIALGMALNLFAIAIRQMAKLSWDEIARGMTVFAGSLALIVLTLKFMPDDIKGKTASLIGIGAALIIIGAAVKSMSKLSWEQLAKGLLALAGSMLILVVSLRKLEDSNNGAKTLLLLAPALLALTIVLKKLGGMALSEIGKALLFIAGVFVIFGVAVYALEPKIETLKELGKVILYMGLGFGAIGVGLLALSVGITTIAASSSLLAKSILVIGEAILSLIPMLFRKIAEGIVSFGQVIIASASTLADVIKALVSAACSALRETIPEVIETVLVLIFGILKALDEHLPAVVDKLFSIIIKFLDKIAEHMPDLIKVGVKLLAAFFNGLVEALGDLDLNNMIGFYAFITVMVGTFVVLSELKSKIKDAIVTAGAMVLIMGMIAALYYMISRLNIRYMEEMAIALSATMTAIAVVIRLIGGMPIEAGLLAIGNLAIFVTGLSALLLALGAIAQIKGVKWLIAEGAQFLSAIGNALGEMFGSVISGFLSKISDVFPKIAKDLSEFMQNIEPFIEGAKKIDSKVAEGVLILTGVIIALTAASVINKLTSWLTGGSSFTKFGEQLAEFAPHFAKYYNSIKHVKPDVVEASARAAEALVQLANRLPKQGGLIQWFSGANTLTAFAEELVTFGPAIKKYSDSVKDVKADAVTGSAKAAEALAELGKKLPKQGGVVQWFSGANTLTKFAEELEDFGPAIKKYSDSVKDVKADAVTGSAKAAEALAELGKKLPKQGGIVQWFSGANTLTKFAKELESFGPAIKDYGDSVKDLKTGAVIGSTRAAEALAELGKKLPKQGGIVKWFTGANTLTKFAKELITFGPAIKDYGDSIKGLDEKAIIGSAAASKALADMASNLPNNVGGIKSWFSGSVDFDKFGTELKKFGPNLKEYADSISGLDVDVVANSAKMGEALGEMVNSIPATTGGIKHWYTGSVNLGDFGEQLKAFSKPLKDYAYNIKGLDIDVVINSAKMGEALGAMVDSIPATTGGIKHWYTGSVNLGDFGEQLKAFSKPLKDYAYNIRGLDVDVVSNSAKMGEALGEMVNNIPATTGGIKHWYTGSVDLGDFGEQLKKFGKPLKEYADSVSGLDVDIVANSAKMAESLGEMASKIPTETGGIKQWFTGTIDMEAFGKELEKLGPSLKKYADGVSGLDTDVALNSAKMAEALGNMAANLPTNSGGIFNWFTGTKDIVKFGEDLEEFAPYLVTYADEVKDIPKDVVDSTKTMIEALVALSEGIPKTGGLAQIFTGANDIKTFGEHISAFGESLWDYFRAIEWIDIQKFSGVTDEFGKLVRIAAGINDLDTTKWSSFSYNLTALANNGIDNFIAAFDDANDRIQESAYALVITFMNAVNKKKTDLKEAFVNAMDDVIIVIDSKKEVFGKRGESLIDTFKESMDTKKQSIKDVVSDIMDSIALTIKLQYYKIKMAGKELMENFIEGLNWTTLTKPKDIFLNSINDALDAIGKKYTDFYNSGLNLVDGFTKAIESKEKNIESIVTNMGTLATKTLKNSIVAKSPSKASYEIGEFFGDGFINAIDDYGKKVFDASSYMADQATTGLTNAVKSIKTLIEEGIESQPTIRPILDLSDVEQGTKSINSIFSKNQALAIESRMKSQQFGGQGHQNEQSKDGATYSFVQNNYSPKALSRLDIYRQTKNQFSTLKGLV